MKANNPCNKVNFEKAIELLSARFPQIQFKVQDVQIQFKVQDVWLDFGAGTRWETIVAYPTVGTSYQMLTPRQWTLLCEAEDVSAVVNSIVESQRNLLK